MTLFFDPEYLKWIRGQSCAVMTHGSTDAEHQCGTLFDRRDIEAAHQKGRRRFGDEWVLPLCPKHHQEQHDTGVETWAKKYFWEGREQSLRLASAFLAQYRGDAKALERFYA